MKMLRFFLTATFSALLLISTAFAEVDLNGFMTPRDILVNGSLSNVYLHNSGSSTVTVYGIYVRRFAQVLPGGSCASPNRVIYPSADITANNITAGAVVMPSTVNAGQNAAVGSNFLYNMIFNANYYVRINIPSSPPGCSLPGCTWGDDSTIYNWCIYLGALGPVSTSAGYTSNIPPPANLASDTTDPDNYYDYNLVSSSDYGYIGPISCNDQTLTCSVTTPQTQSF